LDLAESVNSDEKRILREIKHLREAGIIRRIGAVINYRALGFVSTLVAAHVAEGDAQRVAEAVNSLEGVSHNYLRRHRYNMWFTLQAESEKEIELALANLSGRFGVDFYSLPVKRVFKLDVRFDAEEGRGRPLEEAGKIPKSQVVELTEKERRILSGLQRDLEVTAKPFDFLCGEGLDEQAVLRIILELIDEGVIRRIAGVVDHHKLGFVANVLFCCAAAGDRAVVMGEKLARLGAVSHCYERETFEGWPYNLFAMMHGRSVGEIEEMIRKFVEAEKVDLYELLETAAELRKQPVKYEFREL
jgi:DNA-binding Lrp family transcriptional regulator